MWWKHGTVNLKIGALFPSLPKAFAIPYSVSLQKCAVILHALILRSPASGKAQLLYSQC